MTRYIDADALDSAMYHKSFETDDGRQKWSSGLWIRYKIYEEASREAPTVDVAPIRHGKWLYRKFEVFGLEYAANCYCSACGMDAPTDDGCEYMTRYCPNCGAYMFGGGEE